MVSSEAKYTGKRGRLRRGWWRERAHMQTAQRYAPPPEKELRGCLAEGRLQARCSYMEASAEDAALF